MTDEKEKVELPDRITVMIRGQMPEEIYRELDREATEATIGVGTRVRQIVIEYYRNQEPG